MLSINCLVLSWILCGLQSGVFADKPTQAEICGEPNINGGLAISDPSNVSNTNYYLFRNSYVMPFMWIQSLRSGQIDWQNIGLIKDKFKGSTREWAAIRFGFSSEGQVYLCPKGSDEVFVFKPNGNEFTFDKKIGLTSLSFEYYKWTITTKARSSETRKEMIFVDSTPFSDPIQELDWNVKYSQGIIQMKGKKKGSIVRNDEIFPNTLVYKNSAKQNIKLPIEFDAYLQSKKDDVIFFKGGAACVSLPEPTDPNEPRYCQSFVDTRSLIGCFIPPKLEAGFEVWSDEPEDIEPNF